MRLFDLFFGAVISVALSGCAASAVPAVAPDGASFVVPPPPPPPLAPAPPAPVAQPDPESPHAREIRAEEVLGVIARIAGSVRRTHDEARANHELGRAHCIAERQIDLDAVERAAASLRDRLRASLFDEGDAAKATWSELVSQVQTAEGIAAQAQDCAGPDPLNAGGFGPNDATIRVRPGPLRVRTAPSFEKDLQFADSLSEQDPSAIAGKQAHYAPPPVVALVPGGGGGGNAPATPNVTPAGDVAHDGAMLLRSAQLALAVFEVEKNVDAVEKIATEAGGYLALRGDRQITIRVPKTRFDDAIRRIERLGDVLHRNVSSEDVTDQYVDLELRLKNATAVRARLEKLLEHATVKDAVEIHRELAKVTDEIERLEGKLKLLKDRVAFSTITVTFERTQTQQVRAQALLPFPWMQTMGLEPLLRVHR